MAVYLLQEKTVAVLPWELQKGERTKGNRRKAAEVSTGCSSGYSEKGIKTA